MIQAYHAGYVVDASVAVKWFSLEEDNSSLALALLDRQRNGLVQLAVPDWLFFLEMASALGRKPGASEKSVAEAMQALVHFRLERMVSSETLLLKTNAISRGYRASIYDSAYVAVAEATGFPLVTADAELLKRMKGHSIVLPVWELDFPK